MDLQVGQTFTFERSFTQAQFDRFAALSGDTNPIHVDPEFSAGTKFGRTVAHGMFLYANLVRALGGIAPGAFQSEQELMFPAPTYAGERVELGLRVTELPAAGQAWLSTDVLKPDGTFGCQGRARLSASLPDGRAAPSQYGLPELGDAWKGLVVGQSAELARTYTTADLSEYLDLLGETNPLYADPAFGPGMGLRAAPLPGPLLGAMVSCLLGTELPGKGTNWLKQRFVFFRVTCPGDRLIARVRVSRLRPEKELVNLRTWVTGYDGSVICDGEALVWVGDVAGAR